MAVFCAEVSDKLTHVDESHFADCAVDVTRQVERCRRVVANPMLDHCARFLERSPCLVLAGLIVLAGIDESGAYEKERR